MERNLEIWKPGNLDLEGQKSGMVGRPTVPDFLQKIKKSALKKSGVAKSGIWNDFFAKKGKKHEKIELRQSPTIVSKSIDFFPFHST